MPYANYSTESLRVLSAQQALADAAQFITWFNATHQSGTWISLGCSYSGFLSAAFRSKVRPRLCVGRGPFWFFLFFCFQPWEQRGEGMSACVCRIVVFFGRIAFLAGGVVTTGSGLLPAQAGHRRRFVFVQPLCFV